jgi:hypothetical protein
MPCEATSSKSIDDVDGPSWNHPRSRHDPLLSSPPRPAAGGTFFVAIVVAVMDMIYRQSQPIVSFGAPWFLQFEKVF